MILHETVLITAPAERCFDLTRSVDLHVVTARHIAGRAESGRLSGLSEEGDHTEWSASFLGMRFAMTTRIEAFDRPRTFADHMITGFLRTFRHVYRFEQVDARTCAVTDELTLESRFGIFGGLADRHFLRDRMSQVMRARLNDIKEVAEGEGWSRYLDPGALAGHAGSPATTCR
jgi:ligand-binding SRPBCC domain-containing protein